MRNTQTSRIVRAECDDCGATWRGPNAQGVAARHCDAHGHVVRVDVHLSVAYYPPGRLED